MTHFTTNVYAIYDQDSMPLHFFRSLNFHSFWSLQNRTLVATIDPMTMMMTTVTVVPYIHTQFI